MRKSFGIPVVRIRQSILFCLYVPDKTIAIGVTSNSCSAQFNQQSARFDVFLNPLFGTIDNHVSSYFHFNPFTKY